MSAARSVPLPAVPTAQSASYALPDFAEAGLSTVLDLILEAPSWPVRLAIIDASLSGEPATDRIAVEATSRMVTSWLEQLGERDIGSMHAALAYRLSWHAGWRSAAARFLDAVPDDIIPMLEARPGVGVFACQFLALEPQL